jgi:N-carbamoyl-L-amino-acid hydrolase
MLITNPQAQRRAYDADLQAILNIERARESRRWLSNWPGLFAGPTPLRQLPGAARRLGIAQLDVKDESVRSPLGSFKALGAPVALLRLLMRRWPERGYQPDALLAGQHAPALQGFTVISATDGNHGRALAAAARSIGCRCVIVLHAQVSAEREAPIAALGAEIVRIAGNYDASVQEAARLAQSKGWQVVSDTSYDGYEEIPRDVMQGYGVIADELLDGLPADAPCPYTHVLLQAGVGGLAAGIVSYFWERYGAARPRFIVVEPEQADCLLQSARSGQAAQASGSVDSLMAGLACGDTSPLAWRFLAPAVDAFMTVSDAQAAQAMQALACGEAGDVPVLSGESGAAGMAALQALAGDPAAWQAAGLERRSRVLLINSEGATAPGVYAALAGRSAQQVRDAQAQWLLRDGLPEAPLMERLARHAEIGAIAQGGVCRIALTDADRAGRDQLVAWMRELELAVHVDQIGNIFGVRAGSGRRAAPVMTGSHIDTVATGGRYDGIYGVMAGLEAVRWLNQRGLRDTPADCRGGVHERGRRALHARHDGLAGACRRPAAGSRRWTASAPMARVWATSCSASATPVRWPAAACVRMPSSSCTSSKAPCSKRRAWRSARCRTCRASPGRKSSSPASPTMPAPRRCTCAATPATARRPSPCSCASWRSASAVARLPRWARLTLHPNLINVIASRATLTVDLRNTDEARLQQAEAELAAFMATLATQQGVQIAARPLARFEPVRFDARLVRQIEAAAAQRGLSQRRMTSGAGHDAQMLARICPAAMIFVPSRHGISHNPAEYTAPAELAQGANVLLDVLRQLAEEPGP